LSELVGFSAQGILLCSVPFLECIRNVPEANRERAFINAAKTEAMNQTVRPVGNSVRP